MPDPQQLVTIHTHLSAAKSQPVSTANQTPTTNPINCCWEAMSGETATGVVCTRRIPNDPMATRELDFVPRSRNGKPIYSNGK